MKELTSFWVEYALDFGDPSASAIAAAVSLSCDALVQGDRLSLGLFATDPAAAASAGNAVLRDALAQTGASHVDHATLAPVGVRPRESWPGAPQRVDALPAGVRPVALELPDSRTLHAAHEGGLGRWAVEVGGAVVAGRDLREVLVGALGLDYDDPFLLQAQRALLGEQVSGAWRFRCPCCEQATLAEPPPDTFDICGACGWEDDGLQFFDPSYRGGANAESLEEARARWARRSAT